MKKLLTLTLFSLAIASSAFAGKVTVDSTAEAKLYVVRVHADWCGGCKALMKPMAELQKQVGTEPVLFVLLDFTNKDTTVQASMLANALGLEKAVGDNNGTGRVLLVNPKDGSVIQVLTSKNSLEEMEAAVDKALTQVEA